MHRLRLLTGVAICPQSFISTRLYKRDIGKYEHGFHKSLPSSDILGQQLALNDLDSIKQFVQLLNEQQRKLLNSELEKSLASSESLYLEQHNQSSVPPPPPLLYTGSIEDDEPDQMEDNLLKKGHHHYHQSSSVEESLDKVLITGKKQPISSSRSTTTTDDEDTTTSNGDNGVTTPTLKQYQQIFMYQALPFVGFGFLDNLIMILAGDYIDATLGVTFGISTMAAAGLGNAISDVAGIGSAWYVESICSKVGIEIPNLTEEQEDMKSTRYTVQLGRVVGIVVGCIIGMFPLLFLPAKKKEEESPSSSSPSSSPSLSPSS